MAKLTCFHLFILILQKISIEMRGHTIGLQVKLKLMILPGTRVFLGCKLWKIVKIITKTDCDILSKNTPKNWYSFETEQVFKHNFPSDYLFRSINLPFEHIDDSDQGDT